MKTKFILLIIFCLFLFPKLSFSEDLKLENKINKNLRCLICQDSLFMTHNPILLKYENRS